MVLCVRVVMVLVPVCDAEAVVDVCGGADLNGLTERNNVFHTTC